MATDIDLPFLPSAAQIRKREFASVRRGYDPDQVRDYLAQVAEQVEILEREAREAKLVGAAPSAGDETARAAGPAPSEDAYERFSKRLTTLLSTADREAEGIVAEARADASRLMNEARTEADRIRVDAQARAEEARQQGNELLERAKQEADRMLVGLSERRETLVQHLQDMQTRLVGVAKELEVAMEDPASARSGSPPVPDVQATQTQDAVDDEGDDGDDGDDGDRSDPVDGLEGMLTDDGLDMPEIPSLELDFDAEDDDA